MREPWVTLKGAGSCESRMARNPPASDANHVGGVRRGSDARVSALRNSKAPEGEYIHFRGVKGDRAALLHAEWSRGQATRGNDNPSDPMRNDSYYDKDGRPLLALQTKARIADCPLETTYTGRSAAVLSTNLSGMSRRFGPDGSEVDAEFMVVFAGPPEAASEWSTRRSLFMASDKVINAKPGILPDGRVVLFQHDKPQVILTDPDAGTWRGVRSATTNLMDAMIVGDRAMLQADTDRAAVHAVHRGRQGSRTRGAGAGVRRAGQQRRRQGVLGSKLPKYSPDASRTGPELAAIELRAAKSRRTTSRSRRGRWPGSSTGATATCSAGADRSPRRFTRRSCRTWGSDRAACSCM